MSVPPIQYQAKLETIAKPRTEIIEYYPAKSAYNADRYSPAAAAARMSSSPGQRATDATSKHHEAYTTSGFSCFLVPVGSRRGELFRDEIQVSSNVGADFLTRPMSEVAPNQGVCFCLGGMSQNMRESWQSLIFYSWSFSGCF
jgi:hypothetical protein